MKKVIGLVIIVLAVAAIVSYLSRDRIQEEIQERMADKSDGHHDEQKFPRQEEPAASTAGEPF